MKNYFFDTFMIYDKSFQDEIIKAIDESDDVLNHTTNVKAKMTDWNMEEKPGFKTLASHFLNLASHISVQKYNRLDTFKIECMWGMTFEQGNYAVEHDHWPSTWSGVYFIKPPPNSPVLCFPELNTEVTPVDGLLVLFPGWVIHRVPVQKDPYKMYVVSANLYYIPKK